MVSPLYRFTSVTALVLATFSFVALASHLQAADHPNIVWLISEDNSIHYMDLYDEHGTSTPRIAELAKHGLQFQNAFSNAPVVPWRVQP